MEESICTIRTRGDGDYIYEYFTKTLGNVIVRAERQRNLFLLLELQIYDTASEVNSDSTTFRVHRLKLYQVSR